MSGNRLMRAVGKALKPVKRPCHGRSMPILKQNKGQIEVELGDLHSREGRHKQALQSLKEALEIEPLDSNFALRHKLL